jgi:hypothetical protein
VNLHPVVVDMVFTHINWNTPYLLQGDVFGEYNDVDRNLIRMFSLSRHLDADELDLVVNSECTNNQIPTIASRMMLRRQFWLSLKLMLLDRILSGLVWGAEAVCFNQTTGSLDWNKPDYSTEFDFVCENRVAEEIDSIFANQIYLYNYLLYNGFCLTCVFEEIIGKMKVEASIAVSGFREYKLFCAFIEIFFVLFCLYSLWNCKGLIMWVIKLVWKTVKFIKNFLFWERELLPEKKEETIIYQGIAYVKRIIDDKEIYVKKDTEEIREEEMALPNSQYYPCVKFPTGCFLLANTSVEMAKFASFFRISDYLVTARHVAHGLSSSTCDIYCCGVSENIRKNCKLNLKNVVPLQNEQFFDDQNAYFGDLDVFALKMPKSFWSKMGMRSAVLGPSYFRQNVLAVGFHSGVMMASGGRILRDSSHTELHHTASTEQGYSGSPLYAGGKTVGMHIRCDSVENVNVAIRVEHIIHYLPSENEVEGNEAASVVSSTSSMAVTHGYKKNKRKFRGKDVHTFLEPDDTYTLMDDDGYVFYDMREEDMEMEFPGFSKNKYAVERTSIQQKLYMDNKKLNRWADYDDDEFENVKLETVVEDPPFVSIGHEKPTHVAAPKKPNNEVLNFCHENSDLLSELGFQEGQYLMPEISSKITDHSLKAHLKTFHEANLTITHPPTELEKTRVVNLVLRRLAHAKFTPKVGYRSAENIDEIISSSIVQGKKSPGFPFLDENLNDNAAVLKKYGNAGLRDLVLRDWDEKFVGKVFIKNEPTKPHKIKAGKPRIIVGNPVTKMIKHAAIAKELAFSVVKNWKNTPIKYPFAPNKPGHCEHLQRWFKGLPSIDESDKKEWDYHFFKYLFDICQRVVKGLAVQDTDMSDEEFAQWKADVDKMFDEMVSTFEYRSPTGEILRSFFEGIMKSGWFLTILVNSIAQLVLNDLILIRMNYTDDEILSRKFAIGVGGDDVMQAFPREFCRETYKKEGEKLGFKIDLKTHESFDGVEFFSNKFKVIGDNYVEYYPCNFAKCISNMRNTKTEDLAGALSSHMINYVFDVPKFEFFQKVYMHFRKLHPDLFPLNLYRDRVATIYLVKGFESKSVVHEDPYSYYL